MRTQTDKKEVEKRYIYIPFCYPVRVHLLYPVDFSLFYDSDDEIIFFFFSMLKIKMIPFSLGSLVLIVRMRRLAKNIE